jgi:hypothetical protein
MGTANWTADFSPFDVVPGTDVTANQTDADGDMTGADVIAPNPGDLFVVRSDTESAGVGGQWWTYDTSISVVVRDGTEVKATAVSDNPPNPDSNYWWGTDVGIPVQPGWTVTATGNLTAHEVTTTVTDNAVDGSDNACTIYGTTTYDPTYLRVDVYSLGDDSSVNLSRYVDPVDPVSGKYNWTANFCTDPEPGESGDAVPSPEVPSLNRPGGQAIHHDGGLGATMYHYSPPPEGPQPRLLIELPATDWWDGSQWVNGYWLEGEAGWPIGSTVDIAVNGVTQGTTTAVDPASNPNEFSFVLAESLGLVAGSEITASVTGGPSATLTIQNLSITSANTGTEVVTGTADPGWGPFEVGIGGDGMVQNGINDDGAGNWTVDLDTIDPTLDIQPGADVYARMDDGNGNFVDYWLWQVGGPPEPSFTVDAGVGTPASASGDGVEGHGWPADTPVTVTFDDDTDPTFTLHSFGVTTNPEGNFYAYWDDGNGYFDSYDIATGHYVTVTGGGFTKTTRVTALSVTDVDPDSGLVTGVADAFGNINIGLFEGYDCTDPDPCWQTPKLTHPGTGPSPSPSTYTPPDP